MIRQRCKTCKSSGSTQRFCRHCSTAFCTNCNTTASGKGISSKDKNTCPVCENIGGVILQSTRWKRK